jgi:hypothetical protein
MAVFAGRLEGEDLGLHLRLQVEHQAHHARAVAPDAQLVDVGIAGGDLAVQLGKRGAELHDLQVDDKPLGVLDDEELELDLGLRFERDARVVPGRPDPGRNNLSEGGGSG